MKLLACSDFQLGGGTEYGTPERPRLWDQEDVLEQVADMAMGCGAVLFAGDAFQRRQPSPAEYLVLREWVRHLSALGATCYAIPGNHDIMAATGASALDVLAGHYLYVRRTPGTAMLGPGTYLGMLPWAHPAAWRSHYGHDNTPEGMAQALEQAAAGLMATIREEAASGPGCKPPACTVLLHHAAMLGFSLPNGLATGQLAQAEPVLDPATLAAQGWDFVVAGHIQAAGEKHYPAGGRSRVATTVLVCGSPYVCDYGEAHYEHGVWLLDTEAHTAEFKPLEDRPFVTLEEHASAHDQLGLELAFEGVALVGAVVRVRIHATEEEARRLDLSAIRRRLYEQGAHKVYAVELVPERAERRRVEGLTEDVAPLEALGMYLEHQGVPPALSEPARARTTAYLEEAT